MKSVLPGYIIFILEIAVAQNSEGLYVRSTAKVIYGREKLRKKEKPDKYVITSSSSINYDLYIYPGGALDAGSPSTLSPPETRLIRNIDTNVADGNIYYLDLVSTCVYSVTNFASPSVTSKITHCGISKSAGSAIAYDWLAKNIYWTDGIFNWIIVQPIVTTDIHMYRRLIYNNVKDLSALAIDPINRYMFWFDDTSSGARIERASLAGRNRKVILASGFRYVIDIVADVSTQQIFWSDHDLYSVETANYEGLNRKVIYRELNVNFLALAVDTQHVCMTIPALSLWACADKVTGNLLSTKSQTPSKPYGIAIFNKATQPVGKDFCASAGCQHLCVNDITESICICKEGHYLNEDKKTCTANHTLFGSGIIMSYDQRICVLDFRAISHGSGKYLRYILTGLQGVTFVAMDTADQVIFYTNSVTKEIKSYGIQSGVVRTIQTSTGYVSGLSYDWLQKKLYWCESNTGFIKRISTENDITEVFADTKSQIHYVVVNPFNRTVYWISQNDAIISSRMENGNIRTELISGGSKSGLFFDIKTYRLYWMENSTVTSLKIDGTDLQNHANAVQGSPLLIYKSYAVWIQGQLEIATTPISNDHKTTLEVTVPNVGTVTGFSVYDAEDQPQLRDACDDDNGGCDHICIPVKDGRICKCEFGFTLDSDTETCKSEPITNRFMLTADLVHARIYQVSLDNGPTKGLDLPFVERPTMALFDNKFIYWSDAYSRKIWRSNIDNMKDASLIYLSDFGTYPYSMTSFTSGYLYISVSDSTYTVTSKGYICVVNPETLQKKTLISGLHFVKQVVLHPAKGYLFFINGDAILNYIYRASMDGTSKTVISSSSQILSALAIDDQNNRLFWATSNEIRTSDLSGLSSQTFATVDSGIRSILFTSSYLYYCSEKQQKVVKLDVTTKQPVGWMADALEIGYLVSLDITPKESTSVHTTCANRNGKCSTFCLPTPTSRTCGCQDGVAITSDGKTCTGVVKCPASMKFGSLETDCQRYPAETCNFTCNAGYVSEVTSQFVTCQLNSTWNHDLLNVCVINGSDFLLVTDAQNQSIYNMDLSTENYKTIPLSNIFNPISIDYDPVTNTMFWTDVASKQIRSASPDGNNEKIVKQLDSTSVMDGLALDVPSRLLFYTDTGYDFIAVMTIDGSFQKEIIYESLEEPRSIVADPINSVIYWTDWGTNAKVEKANYDGSGRRSIINTGLGWPNGLAVDVTANKIYWCDAKTHLIESANLDGSNRLTLLNEASSPLPAHYYGLALGSHALFFTDWNRRSLMKVGTDGKGLEIVGPEAFGRLNDINIFTKENKIHEVTNGCSNGRGGCSHICLPKPSNERICACPNGLALQADGVSCSRAFNSSHFLLVTDTHEKQIYALDVSSQSYVTIPLSPHDNPICIDFDPTNNTMFWTDVSLKRIKSARLDGSDEKTILQLGPSAVMEGLAVDIPLHLLFYTDTGNDVIVAMTMDGSVSLIIINETLDEPRAIVTDSVNGMIYWTDLGASAAIEKSNYDGTARQAIINTGLGWPNGLAVDVPDNKIYWCDAKTHLIESAYLDGSSRRVLLSEALAGAHYFGLALDHNTLYFTNWRRRHIMKIQTDGTGLQGFGPPAFGRLNDVHVYKTGQARYNGSNACSNGNGGCSHMCLPKSPNGRTCVCPNGKVSAFNGVFCEATKCAEEIKFGSLAGDCSRYSGETCNFTCSSGYDSKLAKKTVVCQDNTEWDYNLTNICVKQCPDKIQFGSLADDCRRFPNEQCSFNCNAGYAYAVNPKTIRCQENSTWSHDPSILCSVKQCPDKIQFGSLADDCRRFPNEQCSFNCNTGYSSAVNPKIIRCHENSTWSHDPSNLCSVICTGSVLNGQISQFCSRMPGESCPYSCSSGFEKNKLYPPNITCQESGNWDLPINALCTNKSVCDIHVPNGGLINCPEVRAGETCKYFCHENYVRLEGTSQIVCTSSGSWTTDTDNLCQKESLGTCNTDIPNGGVIGCTNVKPGETCRFYCDESHERREGITSIICTSEGNWSHNVDSICQKKETAKTAANQGDVPVPLIAGGAGAAVVIIAIVVVLLIIRARRNQNATPQPETDRGNPPPYTIENPYTRFVDRDRDNEHVYSTVSGNYETLRIPSYLTPIYKPGIATVNLPELSHGESSSVVGEGGYQEMPSAEGQTTYFQNSSFEPADNDYETPAGSDHQVRRWTNMVYE